MCDPMAAISPVSSFSSETGSIALNDAAPRGDGKRDLAAAHFPVCHGPAIKP